MLRALRQLVQAWWATLTGRLRGQPRHPDWNPAFEAVVRFLLLDWIETSSWDFPRLRAAADARPYPKKWVRKVKLTTAQLGGVPAVRFVARGGAKRGATVLFFHGGSYIFGSALTSHAELLARLASETGVEVVGLDYRLAPEDVYPAQLDDALAAFDALLDEGVPASSIVVGGDSAGGNLAVALGLRHGDPTAERRGARLCVVGGGGQLEVRAQRLVTLPVALARPRALCERTSSRALASRYASPICRSASLRVV